MKATWMLLVGCAACGGASKSVNGGGGGGGGGGERADISPVREMMSVYTDGKGHYFPLVEPDPEKDIKTDVVLFYGDGKTFHAANVSRFHNDGLMFEIGFQDPRIPASPAGSIKRELGKVTLSCYGTDAPLTQLPAPEAQAMIGAGTWKTGQARFSPLALAKQGDTYLSVDSEPGPEDKTRYRVFQGKKGSLSSIDVKSGKYSESDNTFTFETARGRLVASRDPDAREYAFGLAWDGKKEAWETMGRSESWKVIFNELGVYKSRTPTPCDAVME